MSRRNYWRHTAQLLSEITSLLDTISGQVQSSGAELNYGEGWKQLEPISNSSKELLQVCVCV